MKPIRTADRLPSGYGEVLFWLDGAWVTGHYHPASADNGATFEDNGEMWQYPADTIPYWMPQLPGPEILLAADRELRRIADAVNELRGEEGEGWGRELSLDIRALIGNEKPDCEFCDRLRHQGFRECYMCYNVLDDFFRHD